MFFPLNYYTTSHVHIDVYLILCRANDEDDLDEQMLKVSMFVRYLIFRGLSVHFLLSVLESSLSLCAPTLFYDLIDVSCKITLENYF